MFSILLYCGASLLIVMWKCSVLGQMVYSVRKNCGRILAEESPVEADIVSTIPESATPAALGFSEATGIPYSEVIISNIDSDINCNINSSWCQSWIVAIFLCL